MNDHVQEDIDKLVTDVKQYLRGQEYKVDDCLKIAKGLKNHGEFSWARRLLDRVASSNIQDVALTKEIALLRVLCTYKDPNLNRHVALDQALEVMRGEFDLATTVEPEVLGLTGAIYKRKWEVDTHKQHLERSLKYYRRRYELGLGTDEDDGYNAINAAYIQDLLAHIEFKQSADTGDQRKVLEEYRRSDAEEIRKTIIDRLGKKLQPFESSELEPSQYWQVVTLAEAYFGIQEYESAQKWLEKARQIAKADWEYFTSAKQLVHIVQLQTNLELFGEELEKTEAWKALIGFLGNNSDALRTLFQGKMGLALSGGGFRASLYHIGLLARLAETDLLRHVEVLSCVSGGSIVGAHYYLELRRLLDKDKRKDCEITRDDFVEIVSRIVDDFIAGVQENPRVRVLANPWSNLKMIFIPSYSRTDRLGALYEKLIYSKVDDGENDKERWLNDMYINPMENPAGFVPRKDNWSRRCKVPELVLNATTLNTGHNWQFTASWMGESPVAIDTQVDANQRYRRMYYHEAPERYRKLRLGTAVGASSCVPGLFEPIVFKDLYPNSTVRLVDGGVYDNQGVASLLEQDCNVFIVSDAAGQMNATVDSGGGVVKPLIRSNSILMQRVRGAQYQDLKARVRGGLLKGFAFLHMKQGLESEPVDWVDCEEPPQIPLKHTSIVAPNGIRKDIQALLAGMRTDLDSFSDIECYALMTSGYRAANLALDDIRGFPVDTSPPPDWKFLKVEPGMKQIQGNDEAYKKIKTHLSVSPLMFFKVWKLCRPLNIAAIVMGLGLLALVGYVWFAIPEWKPLEGLLTGIGNLLSVKVIISSILIIGISSALVGLFGDTAKSGLLLVKWQDTLRRVAIGIGIGIVGWIGAFVHLHVFDRIFKRLGRVK